MSARCGPFLIQTKPGSELPKQLLFFSLGVKALGSLGLAAEMFFLDDVAGRVNNAMLELQKAL